MSHNDHTGELFEYRSVEKKRLVISLLITGVVMAVECIGGIVSHSMALLSDAGHMFTHFFALVISFAAIQFARRPACHHRTFGFFRAEILAALLNSLFILIATVVIIAESIHRLFNPVSVLGGQMIVVSIVGLIANLAVVIVLHGAHEHDLNIKGAFLHILADTFSSVAVIVGAVIIYYTGWNSIDPILSIIIALIIVAWGWGLLRDSVNILLEAAPRGLTTDTVKSELHTSFGEIIGIDDVRIWVITSNMNAMTAQVQVKPNTNINALIPQIKQFLKDKYKITYSTIEVHLT